jgi:predicted house-cleaning noncanonical NTP pyrophosphatase (MazG superfamily)
MNLGWLQGFIPDPAGAARHALEQRYLEEASELELVKKLAAAMKYPQDQAQLLTIADRKSKHLGQLETLMGHFKGSMPTLEVKSLPRENTWEALSNALNAEVHDVESYHELRPLLQEDADMVALLENMIQTERSNKTDLRELMGKLDPYAYDATI